jgi:hypothetical protein
MVTRRAGEADLLDVPYFRMLLRPLKHSRQHQLLLELEQEGNEVYYAAPEFSSPHDLNSAYLRREVSDRTAFFTPSAIGPLPDDGEHHVVFLPESTYGYLCSRPKQVERQPAPIIFGARIPNRARSPDARSVNSEFFLSVGRQLLSIYRRIHPSGDEEFVFCIVFVPSVSRSNVLGISAKRCLIVSSSSHMQIEDDESRLWECETVKLLLESH